MSVRRFSHALLALLVVLLAVACQGSVDHGSPGGAPVCLAGQLDCACDAGVCEAGLYCDAAELCRTCTSDVVGCACDAGQCRAGLVCDATTELCREPADCDEACGAHRQCDQTAAGYACRNECAPGWTFDAATDSCEASPSCTPGLPNSLYESCHLANRECVDDGTTVACAACLAGHVEDVNGDCAPGAGCADCPAQHRQCNAAGTDCGDCVATHIDVAGTCELSNCSDPPDPATRVPECNVLHRDCDFDPLSGATCGSCSLGYQPDTTGSTCVPTCFTLGCAGQYRECDETTDPVCGACLNGFVDVNGFCSGPCESQADCGAGLYCVVTALAGEPRCEPPRCSVPVPGEPGDTYDWFNDNCIQCPACPLATTTGLPWPTTDLLGQCVCETLDGTYWDQQTGSALQCDADEDGWVRESAREAMETPLYVDPAIAINARCDLRTIDRFALVNDVAQRAEIEIKHLVTAGLLTTPGMMSVDLYETNDNDVDDDSSSPPVIRPLYGDRAPSASERNPLTKYCVDTIADYNDNLISDVTEWHQSFEPAPPDATVAWMKPFVLFSYFAELHQGWYEPGPACGSDLDCGTGRQCSADQTCWPGLYVIAERSRCDIAGFPLGYYASDDPGDYWRSCMRRRPGDFANDGPGYDFAEWGCDPAEADCLGQEPRPAASLGLCDPSCSQPLMPAGGSPGAPDPYGACEPSVQAELPPAEKVWRGMLHHSQFRCAQLVDAVTGSDQVGRLDANPGNPLRSYQVNACGLEAASTPIDPARPNPWDAGLSCVADTSMPQFDAVVWLSTRYLTYEDPAAEYQRGCVNERVDYPGWCPEHLTDPDGRPIDDDQDNFGRLLCVACAGNRADCEDGPQDNVDPNVRCETDRDTDNNGHCGLCADVCPAASDCACEPKSSTNPNRCYLAACCEFQVCDPTRTDSYTIPDDGCGQTVNCGCQYNPSLCTERCFNGKCATEAVHCSDANAECGDIGQDIDGNDVNCGPTTRDPTYTGWSTCDYGGNPCTETDTQSRTRTDWTCVSNRWLGTGATETRTCTRNTDGNECGTSLSCTAYGSCGSFSSTCDETGRKYRTCSDDTCSNGSCQMSSWSESVSCTRNTDGTGCGTSCGSWSSCGGFSSVCDETGTQTRSCTGYTCSNGSCDPSSSRTESRTCTRNTDGQSCSSGKCVNGVCRPCGGHGAPCSGSAPCCSGYECKNCGGGNCCCPPSGPC